MGRFAELVVKYRVIIIVLTVAATGVASYQLRNLRVDSDILNYLPKDDPTVVLYHQVGDQFGGNALAMVAIETDDVFNYETLQRINTLTESFEQIEGISHVMSLTDILDIKAIEGGLEVGKLIDKYDIPRRPEELEALKRYTLSKDMYVGNLVSADGKVTLIICRFREGYDKVRMGLEIKSIVKQNNVPEKVYYAGVPFQMTAVTDQVVGDLRFLLPIVSVLLLAALYFSFRSLRGVALPLLTVFVSTIWTLALMAGLGISLTVISGIIPVILVPIGSAYGIHMIARFDEETELTGKKIEGLKNALSRVGVPILLAGITTLIGFLSFVFGSYLRMVREFGLFTALGVFLAMIVAITLIPALLSFVPGQAAKRIKRKGANTAFVRVMDRAGAFILKSEKLIIGVALAVIIVALIGLPRIKREVNMLEYFDEKSDVRISEDMMEKKFGGSIPIQISLKGDVRDPFVLKEMVKLEKFLKFMPDVNEPQSIADLICEMNEVVNGHYTIPDTRDAVANLWFFLEGNEVLDQLVDEDSQWALIQANLGTVNTSKVVNITGKIGSFLASEMNTDLVEVNIHSVAEDVRKEAQRERVERIVTHMEWDLRTRDPDYRVDKEAFEAKISQGLSIQSLRYSGDSLASLERRIRQYFTSGEADVELKAQERIDEIATGITRLIQDPYTRGDVLRFLEERIDKGEIDRDPEAFDFTVEAILVFMEETKRATRIENIMAEIIPLLPGHLGQDQETLKDLEDDLWEINEANVALALPSYTKITNQDPQPTHFAIAQTGMPVIFQHLDRSLIRSQITSLIIAVMLVFLLISFQLKSPAGGLIGITPITVTVLVNFAVMAYVRVPLDTATVLVGGIAIGIGIDYTIHFISRFRTEFEVNRTELLALDRTLETTGRAIIINAFSVMAGFLVLLGSSIVPLQRFSWLTGLTMGVSALADIFLLPATILIANARFEGTFRRLRATHSKPTGQRNEWSH